MRRAYAIAMVVLVGVLFIVAVTANAAYTAHLQGQSDRRWCELFTSLDQPDVPPTTERGIRVQQQIHKLRRDLGCKEGR